MTRKTVNIVSSVEDRPGTRGPSSTLSEYLQKNGLLTTQDSTPNFLVSINHNPVQYQKFITEVGRPNGAVLIRLEPESVYPLQYKKSVMNGYGLVITPGSVQDFLNAEKFVGWPYQYNLNPTRPNPSDPTLNSILEDPARHELFKLENWKTRPRKLVMIAGNKVSPIKDANYSVRRKLAKELPNKDLEVYGPLWSGSLRKKIYHRLAVTVANLRNGIVPHPLSIYGNLLTRYPTAHGIVADKHLVLQETKFSLVVENSNNYVSEKVIDAMINGSIPIYVGPNLGKVGLPAGMAIHSSGKPEEIVQILESLDSNTIDSILKSMEAFFAGPIFWGTWTESAVYEKISRQIADYFLGLPE